MIQMNVRNITQRIWEVDGVNDVYTIWIDPRGVWACSCPYAANHYGIRCKHIKAVGKYIESRFGKHKE